MNEEISPRHVLVTLNVQPSLESRLIDWLLARGDGGFTSYAAHGHGTRHERLSIAEQVIGHQRRLEFRVELPAAAVDDFIAALEATFGRADVYWYALPVLRSGHLGA